MRLPDDAHFSRRWRIHEYTRDFRFDGVWALPTPGGPDDFPQLIGVLPSFHEARRRGSILGTLLAFRAALGRVFGWDRTCHTTPRVRDRLPPDLRRRFSTVTPPMGFTPIYQTDDEWAAELVNRTVHGVIHLSWTPDGNGRYRGQLALLVIPIGRLGRCYLVATAPFRYLILYPRLLRWAGRQWRMQRCGIDGSRVRRRWRAS
jgi:hypothetical protein